MPSAQATPLLTWCNPLGVPNRGLGEGRRRAFGSLADPTIQRVNGRYYLYVTNAQAWESADLISWTHAPVEVGAGMVGPSLAEASGSFWLSGNGGVGLWKAPGPLGPWTKAGEIADHLGAKVHWADLMFYPAPDGTFWCYHHSGSGIGADGIFADRLDPAAGFLRSLAPSLHCFGYDPAHVWERWGADHEHPGVAWIESPWMTERAGRFHLQYSGCGTEFDGYAMGVYESASPGGPFVYDPGSPILATRHGLLRGPGHHCTVEGPDGGLWAVYHVLFRNAGKFDRRLALDRVEFTPDGHMRIPGPSETPQWAPGSGKRGSTGWLPLTVDKELVVSSAAPGREGRYAVDRNVRTWWAAAAGDPVPRLTVDLAEAFALRAVRVIFADGPATGPSGYRWRLETSPDGKAWETAVDRTAADEPADTAYAELDGARGRHVRLTLTGWPAGMEPGVVDLTVFGTP